MFTLKIINTIETEYYKGITSICELKDYRLASALWDGSIVVYNQSYESQIYDKTIKIWRISNKSFSLVNILKGHNNSVNKVIELKDGKICSCSSDKTIKIWDYPNVKTLYGHTDYVISIIETNGFIFSASDDNTLRVWDESTYQSIAIIKNVECCSKNSFVKLNDNTLLLGYNDLYIVDSKNYKVNRLGVESLGRVRCLNVLRNGTVLIGNDEGKILCYDLLSNQIILKKKFHNGKITCLIETEDDEVISCSHDQTINIYN